MKTFIAMAYCKVGNRSWRHLSVEIQADSMEEARTKAEIAFQTYWKEGGVMVIAK